MSASAFSTSDTSALEREIDKENEAEVTFEKIWNEKHQKVCVGWIKQNGYRSICLQFPDQYLNHSVAVCDSLKQMLMKAGDNNDAKVFILADTSYGSCCVDEVAAMHVDADSLIHFGNACRCKLTRLPVLYMFPHLEFNEQHFLDSLETLKDFKDKEIRIFFDIGYHYLLEKNEEEDCLTAKLRNLFPKFAHVEAFPAASEDEKVNSDALSDVCIFVGDDNNNFFNLSLTTLAEKWFIYNPKDNTMKEKNPLTANYIRRRYYYIEKCKDAQTLGLIVGTLTVEGYLDIVSRLQEMAKSHGVKTQIISVGRMNPAKLANFLEIDCFVLIACPFNHIYNTKDYYKPIVSVFEAEMALNPAWHLKFPEVYVTDFKQLLPEGKSFLPFNPDDIKEQDISLVSGRVRHTADGSGASVDEANSDNTLSTQDRTVASHSKLEVMVSNTGLTFEDRTWKGLDPALGQTEPARLQKGLSGIPIKYDHD